MRVLNKKDGAVVPGLYCIGDANGKMMLAHAASTQVSFYIHLLNSFVIFYIDFIMFLPSSKSMHTYMYISNVILILFDVHHISFSIIGHLGSREYLGSSSCGQS